MDLIDEAKDIQEEIDTTFTRAYACLQRANIEHGISTVEELAYTVPIEDSIRIQTRSIMGTEIPKVKYEKENTRPTYAFSTSRESIDIARDAFCRVKELTLKLSRGRKCSVPAGSEYQENAEAGKRAEEYHDSSLRAADKGYQ